MPQTFSLVIFYNLFYFKQLPDKLFAGALDFCYSSSNSTTRAVSLLPKLKVRCQQTGS